MSGACPAAISVLSLVWYCAPGTKTSFKSMSGFAARKSIARRSRSGRSSCMGTSQVMCVEAGEDSVERLHDPRIEQRASTTVRIAVQNIIGCSLDCEIDVLARSVPENHFDTDPAVGDQI